jgi:hypothetical protein
VGIKNAAPGATNTEDGKREKTNYEKYITREKDLQ